MIKRRTLLLGVAAVLAAPAIVRAGHLMPVRWSGQGTIGKTCANELRFAILGWEDDHDSGVVLLHLPTSWRSSYL